MLKDMLPFDVLQYIVQEGLQTADGAELHKLPAIGDLAKELRVSRGGQTVLLVGEAGSPAVAPPADLTWQQGEALCNRDDGCGEWQRYALEVRTSAGAQRRLVPGEASSLGGFQIVLGELAHHTSMSDRCSDWFVARFSVAVARSFSHNPARKHHRPIGREI